MKTMKRVIYLVVIATLLLIAPLTYANVYTEDFNAPFPAWESGWLGTNSNLTNYYVADGYANTDRGNNPDGLWFADGTNIHTTGDVVIQFSNAFGANATSFSLDVAGWVPTSLQVYDMSNNMIFNQSVTLTEGAWTDPGVYAHYSVSSSNGISEFVFTSVSDDQIEGNTSIDNVVLTTGTTSVPEPTTMLLLGFGLIGVAGIRRKLKG